MDSLFLVFALLAGLLHVLIFCMESLWFMQPKIYRRFGAADATEAEAVRLFAFNQGFYNLFLAVGVIVGLGLLYGSDAQVVAQTLVLFCTGSMLAAAIVLYFSAGSRMIRAATMQGVFPMLTWLSWLII